MFFVCCNKYNNISLIYVIYKDVINKHYIFIDM